MIHDERRPVPWPHIAVTSKGVWSIAVEYRASGLAVAGVDSCAASPSAGIAHAVVDGVDSVGAALAGGLIVGAVIGAAEWFALRPWI